MFQQVEAERGAQAVQMEYIQDANLGSPLHDAITTTPAVITDFFSAIHLFAC